MLSRELITGALWASTHFLGSRAAAFPQRDIGSPKPIEMALDAEQPALVSRSLDVQSNMDFAADYGVGHTDVQQLEEREPLPQEGGDTPNIPPPVPQQPPVPRQEGETPASEEPLPEEETPPPEDETPPSDEGEEGGDDDGGDGEEVEDGGDDDDGGMKCSDIDIRQLRDPEQAKKIWDASAAGVIADDYISENGVENWVQNLDQDIFKYKGDISHGWDCREWGSECSLQKECSAYEDSDYGVGAYLLFYSLQQFHVYLNAYHDKITKNAILETLNIIRIQDDLEDKDSGDVNTMIIIAGVMGVFGGFAASYPLAAGALGVAAGVQVTAGSAVKPADKGSNGGKALSDRVTDNFAGLDEYIYNANGAVFGMEGFDPDEYIPGEMQKQSFGSPNVRALGDGQWLTSDPTDGLNESMDEMYNRMRQSLAWAMIRVSRRGFVLMDRPLSEGDCKDTSGATWDPEEEVCFRLCYVASGSEVEVLDHEVTDKLWADPYNIDALEAFRNALNCWVDNDGKPAHPDFNQELMKGEVPKCFFGMVVVSGEFKEGDIKGSSGYITMDDWMHQTASAAWEPHDEGF